MVTIFNRRIRHLRQMQKTDQFATQMIRMTGRNESLTEGAEPSKKYVRPMFCLQNLFNSNFVVFNVSKPDPMSDL